MLVSLEYGSSLNLLRCRDSIRSLSPVKLIRVPARADLDPLWYW
jgi:hypothetical protein